MSLKQVSNLSWAERFALINHFQPSSEQILQVFNITPAEYDTARSLLAAGVIVESAHVDFTRYSSVFSSMERVAMRSETAIAAPMKPIVSTTVHTRPESATKRSVTKAIQPPQRRGRKGSRIASAFLAVPSTPVPVDQFVAEHPVSLAVLRQSKRFISEMEPAVANKIGTINVRQDKDSKVLMIWRS